MLFYVVEHNFLVLNIVSTALSLHKIQHSSAQILHITKNQSKVT
jgi:hypothetical protein